MNGISEEKDTARQGAFARRKAAQNPADNRRACGHLLNFLADYPGQPVSGYMPIRTEIDPLPVMAELSKTAPVGVPVILGRARPLVFHRWSPGAVMQPGPFGAQIPETPDPITPRVVILPLLGFDPQGQRLGYGGGFYDRTLELLRKAGPLLAVGFAYGAQQVDALPVEPTDQPMDAVVTETGVRLFGPLAKTASRG